MSQAEDLVDDFVHHAHLQERYKTAQGNKVLRYIRKLNKTIAEYLLKKRAIETKKEYARVSRWIKEQCISFTSQMLGIVEKDVMNHFKAETDWLSGEIDEQKIPNENTVVKEVMFAAFNDVDTIETYLEALALRIYRIWDSQLRIAYTTGISTKQIVNEVLDGR